MSIVNVRKCLLGALVALTMPFSAGVISVTAVPEKPAIVFYGDSLVEMGDVSRPSAGYDNISFAQQAKQELEPQGYNVQVINHGGKPSSYGANNIEDEVISTFSPDIATLVWGMNDLGGCEGIFGKGSSDSASEAMLERRVSSYQNHMRVQIDALLASGASEIFVMTTPPIGGRLPWTTYDASTGKETTLEGVSCNYNSGIEQLDLAQHQLVAEYTSKGQPVFLFDAHLLYDSNPNTPHLYADLVHPGTGGAKLLAEGWLEEFRQTEALVPATSQQTSSATPTGVPATPVMSKTWPGTISRFETDAPYFALTIDDCYSPTSLEKMLEDMNAAGVKATFFCEGEAMAVQEAVNPGILKRIVESGDRIGYHTMRLHNLDVGPLGMISESAYEEDYAEWTAFMRKELGDLYDEGVVPYARAPYGLFNRAFETLCERKGLTMFYWSGDGSSISREGGLGPEDKGMIVLLHSRPGDAQELEDYLVSRAAGSLVPTSLSCLIEGKQCTDLNAYWGIPIAAPKTEETPQILSCHPQGYPR